jgi:hypothetical protein
VTEGRKKSRMELQAVDCFVDLLVFPVKNDADQVLLLVGELGYRGEVFFFSFVASSGLV